jgi:hypothetical protein
MVLIQRLHRLKEHTSAREKEIASWWGRGHVPARGLRLLLPLVTLSQSTGRLTDQNPASSGAGFHKLEQR